MNVTLKTYRALETGASEAPEHGVVGVTTGIMMVLSREELEGSKW